MKWPKIISIEQAREMQTYLRSKVRIAPFPDRPGYVAGVDAAFSETHVFAAVCLYRLPEVICIEQAAAVQKLLFPYVPGYLSFREGPAITEALKRLNRKPDLILVDGQGIAHPRGIGIASHLGVLLDLPAIGCAKTRLVGDHREPGLKQGKWTELRWEGAVIGAVLRTREGIRPLFVSPGHRVDLPSSIRVVLTCLGNYRIPEPLRCADRLSKKLKRGERSQQAIAQR